METKNNKLILDAYNANPTSMAMAINNFVEIVSDKKMIVLGDMLELGNESLAEHQKILDLIQALNLDKVILVGKEFHLADPENQYLHYVHVDDAMTRLSKEKIINHTVLIKGSRGIQLEKLVEVL
jgi:UDP-N-acetylmuramoyl-tripeptide--D-alanyl-D-alanine ligase